MRKLHDPAVHQLLLDRRLRIFDRQAIEVHAPQQREICVPRIAHTYTLRQIGYAVDTDVEQVTLLTCKPAGGFTC